MGLPRDIDDRPLWARDADGESAWACEGGGGHVVARIGELATGQATFTPGAFENS